MISRCDERFGLDEAKLFREIQLHLHLDGRPPRD